MLKKLIKHSAFTMAEILLSLTIIGVVAAITLPSLTGNINERTWNTQRKALFSRLSQSVALMEGIRGYGTISVVADAQAMNSKVFSSDTATEAFLTAGLSKVLKMNNICNHNNLSDCGLPDKITRLGGGGEKISLSSLNTLAGLNSKYNGFAIDPEYGYAITSGLADLGGGVKTKAAAFETANGESILVHYNPMCKEAQSWGGFVFQEPMSPMCANFIYDLNGKKGPNTIGKDMGFMTLFFPSDSLLVAPLPHAKNLSGNYTQSGGAAACRNYEDSRLPTIQELASITINKNIMDASYLTGDLWSATKHQKYANYGYVLVPMNDTIYDVSLSNANSVRCVKRDN